MNRIVNIIFTFITICLIISSCTNADRTGEFTLIMSGSMHGQLDPCG